MERRSCPTRAIIRASEIQRRKQPSEIGTPLKRGVAGTFRNTPFFSRFVKFRPAPEAAAGEGDGRLRRHRYPASIRQRLGEACTFRRKDRFPFCRIRGSVRRVTAGFAPRWLISVLTARDLPRNRYCVRHNAPLATRSWSLEDSCFRVSVVIPAFILMILPFPGPRVNAPVLDTTLKAPATARVRRRSGCGAAPPRRLRLGR